MKKKTSRSLMALLLVCVMAIALTACSKKGDTLTKEQYQEAVTKLTQDFADIQAKATDLDVNDKDAATKLLTELKKPLEDFKNVKAPKEFDEGHAKMQSGCQAMLDYLDIVIDAAGSDDPTSKLTESSTKIQEKVTAAVTDMSEGAQLLTKAGLTVS